MQIVILESPSASNTHLSSFFYALVCRRFLNVILPKDDPKLRQRVTLRPSYNLEEGERLPYDVDYGLARIFEQELNNFLKIENLKKQLSLCYDFSINNAFKTLDLDAKGYLIPEE